MKTIKCHKCGELIQLENNGNTGKCFNCGIMVHVLSPSISVINPVDNIKCIVRIGRDRWYHRLWRWIRYRFHSNKHTVRMTVTGGNFVNQNGRSYPADIWRTVAKDFADKMCENNPPTFFHSISDTDKEAMFQGLEAMYEVENEKGKIT